MEGDGGLTRTGSALHHDDAAVLVADDLVLLALDRGDDVGHMAGSRPVESLEQRALTGNVRRVELLRARTRGQLGIEVFVIDVDDLAAVGPDMTSPLDALRAGCRREVERTREVRTPIK